MKMPMTLSLLLKATRCRRLVTSLKLISLGVLMSILLVQPIRNTLVPCWPRVYRDMSTIKVARMYLEDFFFYVDTTPYSGGCAGVHARLALTRMPRLDDMTVYELHAWDSHVTRLKPVLPEEEFELLGKFQPSLSGREQKFLMFAMISATQALAAFNITYLVRGGSLIGYWRHHGRIPWDEDVDILVDSKQWPLARKVLSCLPDLQINIGSDHMWKLFHKDGQLWKRENYIKFPYVDIFLYREDSDHVWPLTIWMKMITMKREWALPPSRGVFDGWPISVPHKPAYVLHELYPGRIMSDCYAQIFQRRMRSSVPSKERVHISCSLLRGVYPLVVRHIEDNTVVEQRMLGSRILSTFNTTYHGFLD